MTRTMMTASAAALALCFGAAAQAAPLAGEETVVEVVAPLGALGLSGAPIGSAAVSVNADGNPVFTFPITGGDLDFSTLGGQIEHSGGIALTAEAADTVIELGDFTIDTTTPTAGVVTGNVSIDMMGTVTELGRIDVFEFDVTDLSATADLFDLGDPALPLFLDGDLAADLGALLSLDADLTADPFAFAATNPQAVPLPGAALFFATGAAAFGWRRLKR